MGWLMARGTLYLELAQQVKEHYIDTGVEHAALPTERDLCQEYGVSRDTVRRALAHLSRTGDIYKKAGSGSYIASKLSVRKTPRLTSFTQDMHERGLKPRSTTLEVSLIPASEPVARHLNIAEGTMVYRLVRLRKADDLPMALETAHILALAFNGQEPNPETSLDQQLAANNYRIETACQRISSVALTAPEAMALDQPLSAPALKMHRVGFTDNGLAVESTETLYRADRYDFEFHVVRERR